jgi:hypothetical protein
MSTLQSAHQHGQTSWAFEVGEESPSIQTQRAKGRKAKKVKKYYGTCAFCSKEFVCESKNQKYCRHECYAEHTAIKKANPYKNLECITCLSILGFGCKTIAKKLYKVSHVTARKIILERQLPQSNSKRSAIRKVESSVRPMSDFEKRKREQIKEADKVLKKIKFVKSKAEMLLKAKENCPYEIDYKKHGWAVIRYWANVKKYREMGCEAAKKRWRTNPMQKIKGKLRNGVHRMLRLAKTKKNGRRTTVFLGTTFEDAKSRIESKFRKGMNWDNHGTLWEIDHIMPLSSFDLTKEENLKIANHISNLQPLFIKENRHKRDKPPKEHQLEIL